VDSSEIPGVLIAKKDLAKAKGKDCATELARTLFRGVFTETAIRSCSLGGNRAHGSGATVDPRPSLCPDARDAIFSEYCNAFLTIAIDENTL